MSWTRLPLVIVCALIACEQSTTVAPGGLAVTGVAPQHVTARGGTHVVITGKGFGRDTKVLVRNVAAHVLSAEPTSLTVESPTLVAGPASVEVENGSLHTQLENALEVDPIPINFATVPQWELPTLPAPVTSLVALKPTGGALPQVVAGTSAGLFVLQWAPPGQLGSTALPIAGQAMDMDAGMAAPEPGIAALAVDPDAGLLAVCTNDPNAPMQIIDVTSSPPVVKAEAVQQPVSCQGLAFVNVDPASARWLVARTMTGLAVWQPMGDQFVPRMPAPPALPGPPTALRDATLSDGEHLLLGGTNGSAFWNGTLTLSADAKNGSDFLDMPFPTLTSESLAYATLDANHDGIIDLYVAGPGQDALLIGDGHGGFFNDASELLPFERSTGSGVATGDFDLDGWTDLVIATEDGPDRLFIGSDAAFVDQTPLLGLEGPYGAEAIVVLDIDGDGSQDILTGGNFPGGLRLRLLTDSGQGGASQ